VFVPTRKSSCSTSAPRPRRRPSLRGDDGFTLIETLIASVVLIVGLASLFGLLDTSMQASAQTSAREGATNLTREILEDARTIPYADLTPSSLEPELQKLNGLKNATPGSGWQIQRRGVTYSVVAQECAIDDPKDKYGPHPTPSLFCADSTTVGTEDAQPEDLKRITVATSWTTHGRTTSVKQVETLSVAGQAVGLNATNLELISPVHSTTPLITTKTTETLTFSFLAPKTATATSWSLEGTEQTPTPTLKAGSTEEWTFSWTISSPAQHIYVSDGTYVISAQAINSTGVLGPPISISVTLLRGKPAPPANIVGGFNTVYRNGLATEVAELEWQANSERNVIGYRVYTGGTLVCPANLATLSLATSCIDFNLPSSKPSERTYSVTALYRDASGVVQEGEPGTRLITSASSTAPGPVKNLKPPEHQADGSIKLTWEAPTGTAPAFYRVYRGSKNYTSRYDVTSSTSYTDTAAVAKEPEKLEYWVTAVSSTLTESPAVGPVS
jgi:type II secretory pathway pseudopilin PulG